MLLRQKKRGKKDERLNKAPVMQWAHACPERMFDTAQISLGLSPLELKSTGASHQQIPEDKFRLLRF